MTEVRNLIEICHGFLLYGVEARGLFIKVGDTVSASVLVWPLELNNYPIRFIIVNF